jgi:putative transposase
MTTRKPYPSDLDDGAWSKIEPLLPQTRMGRPPKYSRRELLDAIWYVLRNGIPWRALPHDFPPWQTVYSYFRLLTRTGIWQKLNDGLREQVRQQAGRETEPSLLIADSQTVKTTEKGGLADTTVVSE